jgi:uncharacterized membrane protein
MITIVILVATFIVGAIAGIIVLLRLGIAHEESDKSLPGEPATRAAAATRRVVGWYGTMPRIVSQADRVAN